ncbi:Alpha/Beta hydrolase protein [Zopfochytrium polystomum]|nr:Alpha/Beta hydrolase protein [Zopfochytrium polystomum]
MDGDDIDFPFTHTHTTTNTAAHHHHRHHRRSPSPTSSFSSSPPPVSRPHPDDAAAARSFTPSSSVSSAVSSAGTLVSVYDPFLADLQQQKGGGGTYKVGGDDDEKRGGAAVGSDVVDDAAIGGFEPPRWKSPQHSSSSRTGDGSSQYAVIGRTRLAKPIRLHYQVHGNGPVRVLFIMGLHVTLAGWEYQAEHFGAHGDFTAVVFDNRGIGKSDAPAGRYTTSDMAKDTYELMMWLGWKEDVHVVGVSMGGMIAEELCLLAPEMVASLCLTSTHAGLALPPTMSLYLVPRLVLSLDVAGRIDNICDILFPQPWLDAKSQKYPDQTNRAVMRAKLSKEAAIATGINPFGAIGQAFAVTSHFVSPARLRRLAASAIPTMVVTGTVDYLVHPSNSKYLAKILKAEKFEVFEGRGHALMSEVPDEYNALVQGFIESVLVRKSSSTTLPTSEGTK